MSKKQNILFVFLSLCHGQTQSKHLLLKLNSSFCNIHLVKSYSLVVLRMLVLTHLLGNILLSFLLKLFFNSVEEQKLAQCVCMFLHSCKKKDNFTWHLKVPKGRGKHTVIFPGRGTFCLRIGGSYVLQSLLLQTDI